MCPDHYLAKAYFLTLENIDISKRIFGNILTLEIIPTTKIHKFQP